MLSVLGDIPFLYLIVRKIAVHRFYMIVSSINQKNKKIAVHLHIYYEDRWSEITHYLTNLQEYNYDLFVTLIKPNTELENKIKTFKSDTKIFIIDNIGYDIGAFIYFLHQINLADYDYILKIHTKNTSRQDWTHINNFYLKNSEWNKLLWNGVLKNSKHIDNIMSCLADKNIGMVSSRYLVTETLEDTKQIKDGCKKALLKLGFLEPMHMSFVPGTMFWVKSSLMKQIKKHFNQNDFEPSGSSGCDGSLAHIIERVLGYTIYAQGQHIKGIGFEFWATGLLIFRQTLRFIYQKKITNKGKLIIKVFKLPIYMRKVA